MPKFIISILLACFLSPVYSAFSQSAESIHSLNEIAIPVTINTDNLNDLSPLKNILQNKRIVGMGEATHGSHEFFTMKHKMLEFLVTEMGFRYFGIEANFPECQDVNDYVLYGKGDAKKVIAGMYFWTWNTNEVYKMVEWIRNYNQGKAYQDQVKFYGFDMQFDKVARPLVISKLKQLDSTYYKAHFSELEQRVLYGTKYTIAHIDSVKLLLKNIKIYLTAQDNDLLKLFTRNEVDNLNLDVRLIEQCLNEKTLDASDDTKAAHRYRDSSMAENASWILEHEGSDTKIMLWAHNGHVNKVKGTMGGYLKEKYKDDYYVIGFDFNKGGFRSKDLGDSSKLKNFTVGNAKDKSSGKIFSQLNKPAFFVDIAGAVNSNLPAKVLFIKPMFTRSIGSAFSTAIESNYYTNLALNQQFDGLIFINEVTAAIPSSVSEVHP